MDGRVHVGATSSLRELIGRAKECRALVELLDGVRGGRSQVLVLRGDAGIGKSALLQRVVDSANDFRVEIATGVESEMELPFAGLQQLCAPMLDRISVLPEPQRDAISSAFGLTSGTSPDRLLIGLAILNLWSAVAESEPLLCIVDDAQWLDRASLQVMSFVARRLLVERVGLVFAARVAPPGLDQFPELVLAGLRESDAQTLLGGVLHVALDVRVRDRIVGEAHGNPLAIVEWSRGMSPGRLAGGFEVPAVLPIADQIEEGFRRRLAGLPAPTTRFLAVAAADPTGDPAIVWSAARSLDVDDCDATPAVDAGLIEIGVRVWFRHPLVRAAAYGGASLAERQAAHRALAEATDPDLDPDRRAWHRALGAPEPDDEIAEELERSANRARDRGGFAAAGALLDRSIVMSDDPSRRADRILAAARAYLGAGSLERVSSLLAMADAVPFDEMGRAQLDLLRARYAFYDGDIRAAPALVLNAARCLEALDADLARSIYLHAASTTEIVGALGGVTLRDVGLAAAECPSPPVRTTKDWLFLGLTGIAVVGPAAAVPALRQALETAPDEDTFAAQGFDWVGFQCAAALLLWDIEKFSRLSASYVAMTREMGALSALPGALNTFATSACLQGNLNAADAALTESQQILSETGSDIFTSVVAVLAGMRGDGDAATRIEKQMITARAAGVGLSLVNALWARAMLGNSAGRYEEAFVAASEAMQQQWEWGGQVWFAELVEAAARCNEVAIAHATLKRLAEATESSGSDWALGIQRRSEALLADGTAAEGHYREAIDRLSQTPMRPDLARSHLLYGEWLRRENRRIDAREQLRTGHEMFTTMGMHAFAGRTQNELLATGETVRKRSVGTIGELTPQEAHIARLAADGQTNPEIGVQLFISRRTVEWHLRKIFTKLDITSRRELREALPRIRS